MSKVKQSLRSQTGCAVSSTDIMTLIKWYNKVDLKRLNNVQLAYKNPVIQREIVTQSPDREIKYRSNNEGNDTKIL